MTNQTLDLLDINMATLERPGYGATIAIAHRLSKSVPVEQRSAFLRCTIGNGLEDVRNG